MNGNATQAAWLWRMMLAFTLGAGFLAGMPVDSPARDDAPLDLAAVILHSADLDWLVDDLDLFELDGYSYGTMFSASHESIDELDRHDMYAPGRGALDLTLPEGDDVVTTLEAADWVRSQDIFLVLAEPGSEEDLWSVGVGVTIEEFADEDGATAAFDDFDDQDLLADLTGANTINRHRAPPLVVDVPAVMWQMGGSRWDGNGATLTLSAQLDNRIVSVAFYSSGHGLPDAEVVATLLNLQFKRLMHAEYLHQPDLSSCAPSVGGDGVITRHEEYDAINGRAFGTSFSTSDEELEEAQAEIESESIVHSYWTSQSADESAIGAYDGTFWFAGRVYTFTSERRASEYLETTGERLAAVPDRSDVEEVEDLPSLGDAAVAFNYMGADDFPATIILVQNGADIFSIRLGSVTEYQPLAVIQLAQVQQDRLDDGDCDDHLEVPRILLDSLVPSYRQTSQ